MITDFGAARGCKLFAKGGLSSPREKKRKAAKPNKAPGKPAEARPWRPAEALRHITFSYKS